MTFANMRFDVFNEECGCAHGRKARGSSPTSELEDSELGTGASDVPDAIRAFASKLGAEWSRRRNGNPAPDAMTAWLLSDHQETLQGAQRRYAAQLRAGKVTLGAVSRAWMISRDANMRFQQGLPGVKPLGAFALPPAQITLVSSPLIGDSKTAPVAPLVVRFAEELRRRYKGGHSVWNYRGHGSQGFVDRGFSVDLDIEGRDDRGFFPRDAAIRFLHAVHDAATAVGAQWRVIYNDFDVAGVVNRALGRNHVIFVGHAAKVAGAVKNLIWHGPAPLILHFHLDLAPVSPGARPSTWTDASVVRESEYEYESGAGAGSIIPARTARPVLGPDALGKLAVRIDVVGHASPRWRAAQSAADADRLNQRLSEMRATNVRKAVEQILKAELPWLPIKVPSIGVGSRQHFATASEDNAAVDRSVMVTVDLTTTMPTYTGRPRPPRRIYTPSKVWTLQVLEVVRGAALGYVQIFLRVALKNPYSGKSIKLSGWLGGGGSAMSVKDSFKLSKSNPGLKPVGREVTFTTREALDFDDLQRVMVRMGKLEVSFGIKTMMTYLVLTELGTDPDMLIFDHTSLGLGLIKADAFVVAGELKREGPNPGDWLELPSPPDLVPTQATHHVNDGLVLSFPTGRSGLTDLTAKDRERLKEFVINKGRAIAALAQSFDTSAPRP